MKGIVRNIQRFCQFSCSLCPLFQATGADRGRTSLCDSCYIWRLNFERPVMLGAPSPKQYCVPYAICPCFVRPFSLSEGAGRVPCVNLQFNSWHGKSQAPKVVYSALSRQIKGSLHLCTSARFVVLDELPLAASGKVVALRHSHGRTSSFPTSSLSPSPNEDGRRERNWSNGLEEFKIVGHWEYLLISFPIS